MAVCISGLPHAVLRASSTCAVWPCGESCPPSRFIRCPFLSPCKTTWPTRHFNMERKPRHSVKPMTFCFLFCFVFWRMTKIFFFFCSYRPPEVGEVSSFCIYLFFYFKNWLFLVAGILFVYSSFFFFFLCPYHVVAFTDSLNILADHVLSFWFAILFSIWHNLYSTLELLNDGWKWCFLWLSWRYSCTEFKAMWLRIVSQMFCSVFIFRAGYERDWREVTMWRCVWVRACDRRNWVW